MTDEALPELPLGAFDKLDTGDDLTFYPPPRLVTHIDYTATAALAGFYRSVLPAGRSIDLMLSWVGHLPSKPMRGLWVIR
jgi:hypothetical protein